MQTLRRLLWEEDGQGLTEYALLLMLVALPLVVALGTLGDALILHYDNLAASVGGVIP